MKNITKMSNIIPSKLATPTDLGKAAREGISKVLNPIVANAFALFVKTKNFHWHMIGPHYRDYHLLLDEQATQIFAMIDVLAERVRKLGGLTIRSIAHIQQLQTIDDEDEEFISAQDMLRRLMHDNQIMIASMREAHTVCDKYSDIATTSLLEVYIDEGEHRVWFLFETIGE